MDSVKYSLGIPELDQELGAVSEGTNLLISGPAMSGKKKLADSVLKKGMEESEGIISVSTDYSANEMVERLGAEDGYSTLGVVDCVSQESDIDHLKDDYKVMATGTPDDMTGIGIKVAEMFEEFSEMGVDRNRVALNSVSTILMYSSLKTVFRFLHVFTGRIRSVDSLGLFLIDSAMHEDNEYSTLKPLFDGIIEVRKGDDGIEAKVEGLETSIDWTPVTLN